jgi:hypothetical protein
VGNEVILIVITALLGTVLAIETKHWFGRKERTPKK